jgi:hypothetical protein
MVNKHSGVTVVFSLSSRLCFPALKVWVPVGLGHSILIVPIMAFLFMFSCLSLFSLTRSPLVARMYVHV